MARDIYDTAVPSGSLGYENPLEAFCRTLLVDDLNTGENAVPGCSAIENPVECYEMATEKFRLKGRDAIESTIRMGQSDMLLMIRLWLDAHSGNLPLLRRGGLPESGDLQEDAIQVSPNYSPIEYLALYYGLKDCNRIIYPIILTNFEIATT
jgi:hypothetical protein